MGIDQPRMLAVIAAAREYHDAWDALARAISHAMLRFASGDAPESVLNVLSANALLVQPSSGALAALVSEETWFRARAKDNERRRARRNGGAFRASVNAITSPVYRTPEPLELDDCRIGGGTNLSPERQAELDRELERLFGPEPQGDQ